MHRRGGAARAWRADIGSADDIAAAFCTELQRDADELRAHRGVDGARFQDRQGARRSLADALARRRGPRCYAHLSRVLLTGKGEPRKKLATKKHSATSLELRALLERLQSVSTPSEERRRAAHAAMLAEAALTIADAVRAEYARGQAGARRARL